MVWRRGGWGWHAKGIRRGGGQEGEGMRTGREKEGGRLEGLRLAANAWLRVTPTVVVLPSRASSWWCLACGMWGGQPVRGRNRDTWRRLRGGSGVVDGFKEGWTKFKL